MLITLPATRTIPEISITVTAGESAAPVQGVSVQLGALGTKTTGSAGGCKYQNVTEGTYTITATKEGYEDYSASVSPTVENATISITLVASEEED